MKVVFVKRLAKVSFQTKTVGGKKNVIELSDAGTYLGTSIYKKDKITLFHLQRNLV